MIEPAFGLGTILTDDGEVMKVETAASFRWDFGVNFKCSRLDRPTTIMAMMPAEIMEDKMSQIAQ
jgi:hypothetical protein